MAMVPRPPAPPHTSTTLFGRTMCGVQFVSMRYAVEPTSVGAAAASHDRCFAFGITWCAHTFVNCAKLPQFVS